MKKILIKEIHSLKYFWILILIADSFYVIKNARYIFC
jgi:hypothetical protein